MSFSFLNKKTVVLWKNTTAFINHQNKTSFVAPDHGMQTRIRLLSSYIYNNVENLVESAGEGISSTRPLFLSAKRNFSVRGLRKSVVLDKRFSIQFLVIISYLFIFVKRFLGVNRKSLFSFRSRVRSSPFPRIPP